VKITPEGKVKILDFVQAYHRLWKRAVRRFL